MSTKACPITKDEHDQGHKPCECGEYTHVFSQQAMQILPREYSGEFCSRCGLWMCKIEKLFRVRSAVNGLDAK